MMRDLEQLKPRQKTKTVTVSSTVRARDPRVAAAANHPRRLVIVVVSSLFWWSVIHRSIVLADQWVYLLPKVAQLDFTP